LDRLCLHPPAHTQASLRAARIM